ncbi:MAG: hypothetical protein ABIO86_20990 [Sphingomonas sp.]
MTAPVASLAGASYSAFSIPLALLWTIVSNISLQARHQQLQSVALLPLAMMLAIGIVRAEQEGRYRRARLLAVALAALMAAWLLTAYYMAWFTIFSAGLFAVCWCALSGNVRACWRDPSPGWPC